LQQQGAGEINKPTVSQDHVFRNIFLLSLLPALPEVLFITTFPLGNQRFGNRRNGPQLNWDKQGSRCI